MASKKTGKKKGRKKARTAAQKAATAKLVAMNKGKKTGKKKSRKKGSKKKRSKKTSKGGWRQHSVGTKSAKYHSNLGGSYKPHKRYKPSVGEQFAGEKRGGRFHGPMTPTQALEAANREIARLSRSGGHKKKRRSKKTAHHQHSGKHSGVVTAASILRGAKSQGLKAYVCAGPRMSGCGGGKKGAHVVGRIR